ncbi:MAG TPA: hypothetical protein VFZ24_02830, partial [Longimicrobiales bacterium]
YDTGRLAVAALTAAIPSLLATIALLVLFSVAWGVLSLEVIERSTAGLSSLVAATVLVFTAFEVYWLRRERRRSDWYYAIAAMAALDLALFVLWLLPAAGLAVAGPTVPTPELMRGFGPLVYFQPAIAWAGAFLVLGVVRAGVSRWMRSYERVSARASLDRVLSRLLFMAGFWAAASGLWLIAMTLHTRTASLAVPAAVYSIVTSAVATIFVWSRKLGTDQPSKPFGSALAARLKPRIPQLLAYAVVLLVTVGVMAGVIRAAAQLGAIVAGAAIVTAATLVFFHPNRVGLHSFYRSRLARAYLGAPHARDDEPPFTEEAKGDDIQLRNLNANRPLHLVCCTVNDLTPPEPLTNLQRGAASAVLSAKGFGVTDGRELYWSPWNGTSPTLGAAITASGAAFNSMMGMFSKRFGPAATFVLAMLNLRLGIWLRHPKTMTTTEPRTGLGKRIARMAPRSAKEWWLPGWLFYKELFGVSHAGSTDVHLSDGGHFENMAVYELIRRRCRYIIAADCGADPDRAFDDVANLIRRVRQDFGAEIRLDVSPLFLDDRQCARQPMVAGDIHYRNGEVGVLLLFKPTLTGGEPPDILQYRTRNPRFPNESTGDQFYDEAQWESYRRLGEYAVDTAFAFLRKSRSLAPVPQPVAPAATREVHLAGLAQPSAGAPRAYPSGFVSGVFSRARFEWLPKPPDFERRMERFVERAAELDLEIADGLRRSVLLHATGGAPQSPGVAAYLKDLVWLPEGSQLDDALLTLRRALLFIEETYYGWDLEHTHSRPLGLGIMNYIGRWSATPLLHVWWPLLKGLHSPPFTSFMERTFGLAGIQPSEEDGGATDVITETREPDTTGYATFLWRLTASPHTAPPVTDGVSYIGYHLRMMYLGQRVYSVQAAMLRAVRTRDALIWDASDFFVPAGLWGIGIGEDFLHRLRQVQRRDHADQVVRLKRPDGSDPGAAKSLADQLRMYRTAGFVEGGMERDPRGGGVASIWLTRYAAADAQGAPLPEIAGMA